MAKNPLYQNTVTKEIVTQSPKSPGGYTANPTSPAKLTTAQRDAIVAPVEGIEIYNITTHKKNLFTGAVWEVITSA